MPKRTKNLRDYLDALREIGELREIDREVDPNLEMAAIVRHGFEHRSPATLFTNVKGAQPGLRALGGMVGLSPTSERAGARYALSLGFPADTTWLEMVDELAKSHRARPIPPTRVDTAPCKENILLGKDVDLDRFPIPTLHLDDGNPYTNSFGTIVVRTPDGKWTNWSISRIMKVDANRMTGLFAHPQHITQIWEEWKKIGKPMPFAICQGCEPALPMVSALPLSSYQNEADYLGGHFGEPIEVVRCETVDLEVPASAEIVLEGHVSLEREHEEGPFGEYPGYLGPATSMQPIYHVEAITYRNGAIWPFVPTGRPSDETHIFQGMGASAEALNILREANLPVTSVWQPFESALHWTLVTVPENWRNKVPGVSSEALTRRIGMRIWQAKFGLLCPKVFVLDDDIDPTDSADYIWAIATRNPTFGRRYESEGAIFPLLPCYTEEERKAHRGVRVAFDCLFPAGPRPRHASFAGAYPVDVRERVLDHISQSLDN